MKELRSIVGLAILMICLSWVETYPSTGEAKSYVSTASMVNLLQAEHLRALLAQQIEDSNMVRSLDTLKLKDPNMALFYAVVPGFVVHGAGHFYAAKTKTGAILLASGVVGGALFTLGSLDEALSHLEGAHSSNSVSADGLMATGAILFVGSWTYDVIGAPLAVQKYNEELLRKKTVSLKFDFDDTTNSLRFQIVKRF